MGDQTYLWEAACQLIQNETWLGEEAFSTEMYGLDEISEAEKLLIRHAEEHTPEAKNEFLMYLLRYFEFSPDRHLWLLAIAVDKGIISASEVMRLLPTISFGNKRMSNSFQDLYATINLVTHDEEEHSADDLKMILERLKNISREGPPV